MRIRPPPAAPIISRPSTLILRHSFKIYSVLPLLLTLLWVALLRVAGRWGIAPGLRVALRGAPGGRVAAGLGVRVCMGHAMHGGSQGRAPSWVYGSA